MSIFSELKAKFSKVSCEHSFSTNGTFPHCDLEVSLEKPLTKCAILILLFRKNNQFHFLFTIRSEKLKSFPGEICFPGI